MSTALVVSWVLSLSQALGKAALLLAVLVTVLSGSLAGAGASGLARGAGGTRGRGRRGAVAGLAAGLGLLALALAWLSWEGPLETRPPGAEWLPGPAARVRPALPDPSQAGPYEVSDLLYGSGGDKHWPQPGEKVALHTRPVDAGAFLAGWDGLRGWARTRYWGFDAHRLPLRARVFQPRGTGPFPLVLLVHGNDAAEFPSDGGHVYLARLLASRGSIAVCIDETFLNFSFVDLLANPARGQLGHHLARAFLVLEHLRLWRGWNGEKGHPFAGRVDMNRIGLVGHSAGGEAVALACALNRLGRHPDDARIALDFGFSIRAVAALAPEVGVYRPGGRAVELSDVSYLVIQGSGDGMGFRGSRQYESTSFTRDGGWFKAGLYVERADHNQWSSVWGRFDLLGLENGFLNRRALLSRADQEQIARVYVSAFFEAALAGHGEYRDLFLGHRLPVAWLPDVVTLHQYQDSSSRSLATYEEDVDAATATLPGGVISARGLTYWREAPVGLKWGSLGTRAAFLAWGPDSPEPAIYSIDFPAQDPGSDEDGELTFRLAQPEASTGPLDLTLELTDASGRTARQPLSHVAPLLPHVVSRYLKPPAGTGAPRSEVVFQDFGFRLSELAASSPGFDLRRLRRVALVFDRSPSGSAVLDDVGWRRRSLAAHAATP